MPSRQGINTAQTVYLSFHGSTSRHKQGSLPGFTGRAIRLAPVSPRSTSIHEFVSLAPIRVMTSGERNEAMSVYTHTYTYMQRNKTHLQHLAVQLINTDETQSRWHDSKQSEGFLCSLTMLESKA